MAVIDCVLRKRNLIFPRRNNSLARGRKISFVLFLYLICSFRHAKVRRRKGARGCMNPVEEHSEHWRAVGRFRGLHASMSLEKDGLVLGAKTLLVKRDCDGALALGGEETRLLTLLAVAYGYPLPLSLLDTIRKASKYARAGDEGMAAMLIALARMPRLRDPADAARRLFIADGLMEDGISPRDIWTALDFDPAPLDELEKYYNPNEPRVPSGSGRSSGEWTSGNTSFDAKAPAGPSARSVPEVDDAAEGATEGEMSEAASTAGSVAESGWEVLPEIAARVGGPLAFLYELLHSTPAGGDHHDQPVPGRPDLLYSWNDDEMHVDIRRASDGKILGQAFRRPDGKLRLSPGLWRLLNVHPYVDPDTLPPEDPRSSRHNVEPQICPEPPRPDKPQGTVASMAYVTYVKTLVNQPPTPPGLGYQLPNPWDKGKLVFYDDCRRKTGTMIEYKGRGYAKRLVDPKAIAFQNNIASQWLGQATRQVEASGGRPVEWYFAEMPALEFARNLFNRHEYLKRIKLIYAPLPETTR